MNHLSQARPATAASADEGRLTDYLALVVDNWLLIAALTLAALLMGATYAWMASPVYRADALIQVEDNNAPTSDALGELAAMFENKATTAAELELMRSRLVIGATVDLLHLDLQAQPRYFPLIGAWMARRASATGDAIAPAPFGLARFAWGNERIALTRFEVPEPWRDQAFTLVAKGEGRYALVAPDGRRLLNGEIGHEASAPFEGATVSVWVAQLDARPATEFRLIRHSTQRTVNKLRDDLTVTETARQSGVIGVALDDPDPLRAAAIVNSVAGQYLKQNRDRKSAEAEQTLSFLAGQLPEVRAQLEEAERRYNAYLRSHGTLNLPEEGRLLLQQMIDNKARTLELQQQREELLQRFNDEHPSVAALNSQIGALKESYQGLERQLSTRPDTEQGSLGLLRDVRVDTELYTGLLNRTEQLRVMKAGQIGNVRLVDSAIVAETPVRPRKALVLALALACGIVAGVVAALAKSALHGGIEDSEVIEREFGLPVYAVVPRSAEQPRMAREQRRGVPGPHVLAIDAPDDISVEALRSLRTALQFASLDAANNIVMVTGPTPNTGKSFLSVNLAVVLASLHKRVLLIDADMRRGELHAFLGVKRMPGLADVLNGVDLASAIHRDVLPELDLLSAGIRASNPAELLSSERFLSMLEHAKSNYDLVVIDTPPVLAVTDAALIGAHAGTTLLAVRHGCHSNAVVRETIKRLRHAGVVLKGALLNDVPLSRFGSGAYHALSYEYTVKDADAGDRGVAPVTRSRKS